MPTNKQKTLLIVVTFIIVVVVLASAYFWTFKKSTVSLAPPITASIRSFQVTINKLGSFPCYTTVTTLIKDDGNVTSTRNVTNPSCVDASNPSQLTDAYKLEPAQLTAIKAKLEQTNVFSFKDSYIDEKILDYAGDRWEFIIDGEQKEIKVRVASSDDLPRELRELLDFINTTTFSGRYPL